MKRRLIISGMGLGLIADLSLPRIALAQDAQSIPPLLANILVKAALVFDGMLDFWVSGNTLTDPLGERLVHSVAQVVWTAMDLLSAIMP